MSLYFKFILIYLILNNKWVIVESSGSEADLESGTEGEQAPQSTATQLKPEVYSIVIKLFKADANDSNKTVELATTEYRTEKLVDEHLYVFNSGINCNLIKIDDKDVWKYDSSKHNGKYPKGMRVNKRFKFVLVEFDGTVKVLIKGIDGNWTPFELDIKLFKDDSNNNKVEIKETDFYEDQYLGNLTYVFKPGVKCTLVKFGDKDVWKKGDEQVDEPKSVTYNFMHRIVVRNAKKSVVYKKDDSGNWAHYYTIEREEQDNSAKTSGDSSTSQSGSPGSGLSSEKPDDGASSCTPVSAEASGEVEDGSAVVPEATDANEVSKDTGLRGTGAPTDSGEKEDETASSTSGGADTGEQKEKGSEDQEAGGEEEKEANNEEEKETGAGSDDASSSHVGAEASESTDLGVTAQTEADGGSGTDTSSGEGTGTGDGSADKGAGEPTETGGEGEDGSSQPSSGAPTSGGTDQTSGSDGSSATPPASSGGDGTSATPGQGGTATSPTAGSTNSSTKTGVELSLKATAATDQFEYNKVGNTVTYTAKDNYAFKSVKTKKGGSSCCGSSCCGSRGSGGSDVTIWDVKDASEYASKVVLYGKGKKKKFVTIHKLNKYEVFCLREGKDKPWTVYDTSKTNPVPVNIAFKSDTFKYTNKLEGGTRTFEAKTGFIFNQVRCKNDDFETDWIEIWKTDNENEYAKKVVVEGGNKLTIHIEGTVASTKVFNKGSDGKWTEDTQASTKKSSTGGSGGTDQSGGGGTGTGGDGSGSPSGGGGGDGSGKPSGGGPTSGGTDQTSGQSMPSGGGGPTSGGTGITSPDSGLPTGG